MALPISSSGSGNYINQGKASETLCSSPPEEELTCSAPPEESVCKAPEDKAKVKSLPKGKADQPVNLFQETKKQSIVPKVGVESAKIPVPEELVCSEENFNIEPAAQNSEPVEADVNVDLKDNKIKVSGNMTIKQEFVQTAIQEALKANDKVENAKITFDSKTNSYLVTGKYNPDYLPKQNFSITLKPTIENQQLGFKLGSDDYWGVFNNTVGEKIAEKISSKGVSSKYNSDTKVISLDTDSVLQKTKALHYTTKADLSKNEISLGTNNIGDLSLGLSDPDVNAPLNKSAQSDVSIKMDKPSFQATLQKAFGANLKINELELKDGEATIKGKAKANEIKNGLVGLVGLWGIGTGDADALNKAQNLANSEAPQVDTEIKISIEGNEVVMKPKSSLHLVPLADSMKKEGYKINKVDEKKGEIRFSLNELLPAGSSGNINNAKITGKGLSLDSSF